LIEDKDYVNCWHEILDDEIRTAKSLAKKVLLKYSPATEEVKIIDLDIAKIILGMKDID
jgi:hypothetical protein